VLSPADRCAVLAKTSSRCHICGGEIEGTRWHADHVKAHITGAEHEVANYLPVHAICNNYRWDYSSDEFQWILKLGVWLRSEVERETRIGRAAGEKFTGYDAGRAARRERAGSSVELTESGRWGMPGNRHGGPKAFHG